MQYKICAEDRQPVGSRIPAAAESRDGVLAYQRPRAKQEAPHRAPSTLHESWHSSMSTYPVFSCSEDNSPLQRRAPMQTMHSLAHALLVAGG